MAIFNLSQWNYMQMYYVIKKQKKCKLYTEITKYEMNFKFANNRLLLGVFIYLFLNLE